MMLMSGPFLDTGKYAVTVVPSVDTVRDLETKKGLGNKDLRLHVRNRWEGLISAVLALGLVLENEAQRPPRPG